MKFLVTLLSLTLLPGCASWKRPHISFGEATVVGNQDGNKVTLDKNENKKVLEIPAETRVTSTHVDPVPATPSTPYIPAKTITEWTFLKPSSFVETANSIKADTGVIDTTVATHRIDVQSRMLLLYAALACGAFAGVLIYFEFPHMAGYSAAAGVLFFIAWKVSDLPSWFWVLGVVLLCIGFGIFYGHGKTIKSLEKPVPTP